MKKLISVLAIFTACEAGDFDVTNPKQPDGESVVAPKCEPAAPPVEVTRVESIAQTKCVAACNNYAPCVAKCNQAELDLQPAALVCPTFAPETLRFGSGSTILHMAAAQSDWLILVDTLYPSLLEVQDGYGRTPLHTAAIYGQPDNIRRLLYAGANYHAVDINKAIALHYAAQSGIFASVEELLMSLPYEERKWALTVQDQFGFTPLFHAVFAQQPAMVDYLIELGADVTTTSNGKQWNAADYIAQNPMVDQPRAEKMLLSLCNAWKKTANKPMPSACEDIKYIIEANCYVDILKTCEFNANCYQQNMASCN